VRLHGPRVCPHHIENRKMFCRLSKICFYYLFLSCGRHEFTQGSSDYKDHGNKRWKLQCTLWRWHLDGRCWAADGTVLRKVTMKKMGVCWGQSGDGNANVCWRCSWRYLFYRYKHYRDCCSCAGSRMFTIEDCKWSPRGFV